MAHRRSLSVGPLSSGSVIYLTNKKALSNHVVSLFLGHPG